MSSPRSSADVDAETPGRPNGGGLRQVLDVAFGFFVWAIHFLVVYVATAVACTLRLGAAGVGTRATFLTVLAIVTVLAAAAVVWHGYSRYRRWQAAPAQSTRMAVTVGCDAVALVAIVWQLFPIWLVPPCA